MDRSVVEKIVGLVSEQQFAEVSGRPVLAPEDNMQHQPCPYEKNHTTRVLPAGERNAEDALSTSERSKNEDFGILANVCH